VNSRRFTSPPSPIMRAPPAALRRRRRDCARARPRRRAPTLGSPVGGSMATRLSAPTRAVWLIALIVGGIGILDHMPVIHLRIGIEDFWLVAGSLVLLLVANLVRGL